jgi:hypothetical protein
MFLACEVSAKNFSYFSVDYEMVEKLDGRDMAISSQLLPKKQVMLLGDGFPLLFRQSFPSFELMKSTAKHVSNIESDYVVEDFNGDGLDDIFISRGGWSLLFINENSGDYRATIYSAPTQFCKKTEQCVERDFGSVSTLDHNTDGFIDIKLTYSGDIEEVWVNNGSGRFSMPSLCTGLPAHARYHDDSQKGDVDPTHSYQNTEQQCDFSCDNGYDWDGEFCAVSASLVDIRSDGSLIYSRDAMGNRVPDFSYVGYKEGNEPIPDIGVKYAISPIEGDDTLHIQQAINYIESLPLDEQGFRGALLLNPGIYQISSSLNITKSGVVLRGAGAHKTGTIIIDNKKLSDTSILVRGAKPAVDYVGEIVDEYLPVGSIQLTLSSTEDINEGDRILLSVNYNHAWLSALGAVDNPNFNWDTETITPRWERRVVEVDHRRGTVVIAGGITSIIDRRYSSVSVQKISEGDRIFNVGVEDLILLSNYNQNVTYTATKGQATEPYTHSYIGPWFDDDDHTRHGVIFEGVRDFWLRRTIGFYYRMGLFASKHNLTSDDYYYYTINGTIEDTAMIDQVSTDNLRKHKGTRGYSYDITGANRLLLQRNYTRHSRHGFVTNSTSSEIVFVDSVSEYGHLAQEAHQRWSQAVLYDNIYSDSMFKLNQSHNVTEPSNVIRHGQTAVSSVLWNILSESHRNWEESILVDNPTNDLGHNYVVGVSLNDTPKLNNGPTIANPSAQDNGSAVYVEAIEYSVMPRSLYFAQLNARKGWPAVEAITKKYQRKVKPLSTIDLLRDKFDEIPKYQNPNNPLSWLPDKRYYQVPE